MAIVSFFKGHIIENTNTLRVTNQTDISYVSQKVIICQILKILCFQITKYNKSQFFSGIHSFIPRQDGFCSTTSNS